MESLFVMDRLPLQLASGCVHVEHVRVERVVDAAKRRPQIARKVGVLFQDQSAGNIAQRRWSFGDGAIIDNVANPMFKESLKLSLGC